MSPTADDGEAAPTNLPVPEISGAHPALQMAMEEGKPIPPTTRLCLGCLVEECIVLYGLSGDLHVTCSKVMMQDAVPCDVCKVRSAPFQVLG